MNGAIPGIPRGCGKRQQGGIYAETGLAPGGMPIEVYFIDPPKPYEMEHKIGVELVEIAGMTNVIDDVLVAMIADNTAGNAMIPLLYEATPGVIAATAVLAMAMLEVDKAKARYADDASGTVYVPANLRTDDPNQANGTFIVMDAFGIMLERISLGALIIALGMLVDNAIVVTEGMLIKIRQGEDRIKAARDVVAQQIMPLAGAT
ncbi:hypothetical protein LCGC14_2216590, partial [marine sediment metagenome]